ncbi:tRNA_2-thiocytidine biosynthesis protein [Hexamita inflata]|uniref:tRNA 2-thiocytidine biosynthesis protein n=1 Tax=Hexamita inflata TaxID=28002 RepID=A0AA86NK11_9EUKA|nr:tRNA 2-thiocytidine biosynthesis protein [Hexamita inflata]
MKFLDIKQTPEQQQVVRKIQKSFGTAVGEYKMIEQGDRVALALSGGKDSWTLLHLLIDFQRRVPIKFEVIPITVETGFAGFDANVKKLEQYIEDVLHMKLVVLHDKFPEIIEKHKTPGTSACSFCARMRRGALYTYLQANNINKLALGHHADDAIESMLMSQQFNGVLWTQVPIVKAKDKPVTVIRPLILTYEQQMRDFTAIFKFPVVTCNCPFEGNPAHKRAVVKKQVKSMCEENEAVRGCLLKTCREMFEVIAAKRAARGEEENDDE